jgi:hypothetical protein
MEVKIGEPGEPPKKGGCMNLLTPSPMTIRTSHPGCEFVSDLDREVVGSAFMKS